MFSRRSLPWLAGLTVWALVGCGGPRATTLAEPADGAVNGPVAETPASEPLHHGAWYGAGEAFPDGQLCMVLCANGRMFLGDKRCEQTDAGDFAQFFMYRLEGARIEHAFKKVGPMAFDLEGPGRARLSLLNPRLARFRDLPLEKVADDSPMCADPGRVEGDPDLQ